MTTIHLSDAIVEALKAHDIQDFDNYVVRAILEKLQSDDMSEISTVTNLEEYVPDAHVAGIMQGLEEVMRGEGMEIEEYIALRRAQKAEAKKQREAA
jgi:hypothetical protein